MEENRECIQCRDVLPLNHFDKTGKLSQYRTRSCKSCRKGTIIWTDIRYKRNISGRNYKSMSEDMRFEYRCNRYNITSHTFFVLANLQEGKCAICKNKPENVKELVIDHCHNSNEVRGLLCNTCNTAIGLFKESEDTLKEAIKYLEKNPMDIIKENVIVSVPVLRSHYYPIKKVEKKIKLITGPKEKPTYIFNRNKQLVAKFRTPTEAAKVTGISYDHIKDCIRGKRRTVKKGEYIVTLNSEPTIEDLTLYV